MPKTLMLVGSGEFTKPMLAVDEHVLKQKLGDNLDDVKVAIIPLAAGAESDYTKWIDDGVDHFSKLGVKATGIYVTDKRDANDLDKLSQIESADMIYFSGGDPGYLFENLKDTLLWEKVNQKYVDGAILAGSSAGAMTLGSYVLSNVYELDKDKTAQPLWSRAFGLVNNAIIPHYDYVLKNESELLEAILAKSPKPVKETLLAIDENTAVVIEDAKPWQTLGVGGFYFLKA